MTSAADTAAKTNPPSSNFLRQIIERDLASGTYSQRRFAGTPGDAAHHAAGPADPAKIRTRFPPEPNGYLHIGHAKSITLNFGLAAEYGGVCHLRFDDTNPEKEEQEYVDAILDAVQWLGYSWEADGRSHLFYASNYFDFMYRAAEALIEAGHAYVDEQSADEMRQHRGDFGNKGTDSPFRTRTPAENQGECVPLENSHECSRPKRPLLDRQPACAGDHPGGQPDEAHHRFARHLRHRGNQAVGARYAGI